MSTARKTILIHPFLFAAFPFLFIISHNIRELTLSINDVFLIVLAVLLFAGLLFFLLRKILKNGQKAALLVSLFMFLFFSYGHFYKLIIGVSFVIGGILIGEHKLLFPVWIILLFWGSYATIRTRRNLAGLGRILNYVALVLVIIPLGEIAFYYGREYNPEAYRREVQSDDILKPQENSDELRDIYYIILDRYGNEETLKEFYKLDNQDFIAFLIERGFYVASQSRANYLKTAHSLASSLNMEYINYLGEDIGENSSDWTPLHRMIRYSKVIRMLKSSGYRFVFFGSFWQPLQNLSSADENVNLKFFGEYYRMVSESSMLFPFIRKFEILDWRYLQWKRINYQFARLSEMPETSGPTFVFAHLLVPHWPYVFHTDGRFKTFAQEQKKSRPENYREQVIFTNTLLMELVDNLIARSRPAPIIILQADEGPYPDSLWGKKTNWREVSESELNQKFGILNAYYFPAIPDGVLYHNISPVNSFRLVFNLYFNTDYDLLPDESYIFEDLKHIYKFSKTAFGGSSNYK